MVSWKFIGLAVVVACVLILTPVSACHPVLSKTGPSAVCPSCEYFEYTITASASDPVAALRVQDTLPNGVTFLSADPSPTTISGQTLTWVFTTNVMQTRTIKVKVKPSATVPSVSNFISGDVKLFNTNYWTEHRDTRNTPVVTTYDRKLCTEAPEFPSAAVPVAMIIGLLGAILYIRRIQE